MKTRAKHTDTLYRFGSPPALGRARIRIFRLGPDRPAVVVITELPGDGPSVTNEFEAIASAVARDHSVDPETSLFIEHLPGWDFGPEEFSAVSLDTGADGKLCKPSWSRVSRGRVELLTGSPLSD